MEKKYILTDDVIDFNSHTLHRIKAVRDFDCVKAGDLGGFIKMRRKTPAFRHGDISRALFSRHLLH